MDSSYLVRNQCVLLAVTSSTRSWNDCSTFEQMQHHFFKWWVSVGFSSGTPFFVHFTWLIVVCVSCTQPFPSGFLLPQTSDGQTLFIRMYLPEYRRLLRAQHVESSVGIDFREQGNGIFASYLVEIDLAKIAFSCHFAFDLLCYKDDLLALPRWYNGHHCPWSSWCFCALVSSCSERR